MDHNDDSVTNISIPDLYWRPTDETREMYIQNKEDNMDIIQNYC